MRWRVRRWRRRRTTIDRASGSAVTVHRLIARNLEGEDGRSERIRTSDPCVPNAVLYQAEPHSDRGDGPQGVAPK